MSADNLKNERESIIKLLKANKTVAPSKEMLKEALNSEKRDCLWDYKPSEKSRNQDEDDEKNGWDFMNENLSTAKKIVCYHDQIDQIEFNPTEIKSKTTIQNEAEDFLDFSNDPLNKNSNTKPKVEEYDFTQMPQPSAQENIQTAKEDEGSKIVEKAYLSMIERGVGPDFIQGFVVQSKEAFDVLVNQLIADKFVIVKKEDKTFVLIEGKEFPIKLLPNINLDPTKKTDKPVSTSSTQSN